LKFYLKIGFPTNCTKLCCWILTLERSVQPSAHCVKLIIYLQINVHANWSFSKLLQHSLDLAIGALFSFEDRLGNER